MSGIHKASVFGDFKALWMYIISFSTAPFCLEWLKRVAMGEVASMPAGDFTVCLMTLRQSVWGIGHFRELRGPAISHSEISRTGLG